jgi:glycosyltransferase involved in cell wall biosynthesis
MLGSILGGDATRVYTHRAGITRYGPSKRLRHVLTRELLRRHFHAFSANTRHAAHAGANLYRLPASEFDVIYNGLDFESLRPLRSAETVRSELGLESTNFVMGTAATLKPWKRIERLVALVATISEPSMRLLVVGDGPEREHLEMFARERGIRAAVIFAGPKSYIGDYLQVMDAFCLPSTEFESFGNAAVEAMGVGLPTVVFADGGGLPEHIDDGQTGFVVSDEAALSHIVRRLIGDRRLRRRLGEAAMAAVRSRYTRSAAHAAYLELYERAEASRSRQQKHYA